MFFFFSKKDASLTTHLLYDNERISFQIVQSKSLKKSSQRVGNGKRKENFLIILMIALVCTTEIQ